MVTVVTMMLSVNALGVGTGTLNRASGWYPAGSNFTVTATPAGDSVFASWLGDTNGCVLSGNQITLTADKARQIVASFIIARFSLNIASLYGTAVPAVGVQTNDYGTILNNYVVSPDTRGTTQYVCSGWAMTGNAPASGTGTNFTMTVTNNASLAWQWRTNYYLTTSTSGSGGVSVASQWCTNGAAVAMTATASNFWNFAGWTGDTNGCAIAGNVITAAMNRARSITANFTVSQRTLQIASAYGTAVPAVGISTNNYGAVLNNYVVSPDTRGTTQYVCIGWAMTGNSPASGTGTNFTMTVTNNAVLNWQWATNYWIDLSVTGN